MMRHVVLAGDRVQVHYTTFAHDQSVIETSVDREPLEFVVGAGQVVDGLDRAVVGMKVGDRKRLPVMPEQAFGQRETRWQQSVPRCSLPERVSEGDQLSATLAGQKFDVWVRHLLADEAVLDANHPLAGETLLYEFKVIDIADAHGPSDSIFG
jgi:peptidylprolyl isomerase